MAIAILAGCSGGGAADITQPAAACRASAESHFLWGLFQFTCDPEAGTMEITSLRVVDMHMNVLPFLEPPPFVFLSLESLEINGNIIDAGIGLRHPFLGLTEFTGFDVSGILISNGSYSGYGDMGINIAGPGDLYLVNADGHARWWNPDEFPHNPSAPSFGYVDGLLGTPDSIGNYNGTLNGYKYFADGLGPDDPVTAIDHSRRGMFGAGQKNIRHYTIDTGDAGLVFNYAVDACWEFPQGSFPWEAPDDFGPAANRVEPYCINVRETANSLWHDGASSGGQLSLDIDVYDWFNLDQDWVQVESPGAFDPVEIQTPTGNGDNYSTFHVDLTEVNLSSSDDLMIIISAYCEDVGFQDFLPGKTTATYKVHYAEVSDNPAMDPVAIAKTCDCLWIAPGESIEFDGTDSHSPNGDIISYEWDFDGDGTFGDTHNGPDEKPVAIYMNEGDFWVNLKVTDVADKTDTLDPDEQLHVFVGYFNPPTAVAEVIPTIGFINFAGDFIGSGSIGTIDLYEWDFEGDCIWDYADPAIGDTTHAYIEADDYTAILRVTGDGCSTDDVPVRMIDPEPVLENGNFWDGDFPPWEHGHWEKPPTKIEEIVFSPIFKNIVHFYSGPTSDGNCTWIIQNTDYDLSGYTSLYFNFFFYVDYNTLNGDGWMGGEPDIMLQIEYESTTGVEGWQVWYGYDTSYDGHWEWDSNVPGYVVYHEQDTVPLDTWCERKTIDLMTLDPMPKRITMVRISCRGWSWNEFVALPWFSTE